VIEVQTVPTHQLSPPELAALRALLDEAFEGGFTDDDWDHTVGGVHVLAVEDGIVAHAAVVDRLLMASHLAVRTGYVEGVATATTHRGRGYASTVMRAAGRIIQEKYELGALSTDQPDFYVRLGWELWRGPTYTNAPEGPRRTAEEDGTIMVLRTRVTEDLDSTLPLTCDWRSGDVW
jgi:aminoglycoside 2'-N-acetyltransferase I